MSELRVRDLEEWVISALRASAKRHKRSLVEELRVLLRDNVQSEKQALAAKATNRLEKLREKYGTFSDSTAIIRGDRDTRG